MGLGNRQARERALSLNINWEKTSAKAIASRYNVSLDTVYRWAKLIDKKPKSDKGEIDWSGVDYSFTTKQLCELHGKSRQFVCRMRKKYAPETVIVMVKAGEIPDGKRAKK